MPTANGVLVQMEQDKEEEKKACNGENGSIDSTELVNGDMGRTDSRAEDSHSRTDRTGSQSSQENEEGGTNSKQEHAEEASTEQKVRAKPLFVVIWVSCIHCLMIMMMNCSFLHKQLANIHVFIYFSTIRRSDVEVAFWEGADSLLSRLG